MFGSDSSRHGRSRGRGSSATLESLAAELAYVRGQSYVDQLEVVRLGALVQGLSHQIEQLSDDLLVARQEAVTLRLMPTTVDPRIEEMAREILHLRDVIAAQQSSIVDMTSRVGDLLIQVASAAPREPAPAAPARQEAPVAAMASARPIGATYYDDEALASSAMNGGSSFEVQPAGTSGDAYAFAVAPTSGPAAGAEPTGEFDDATLRRLRLIRQAFEN